MEFFATKSLKDSGKVWVPCPDHLRTTAGTLLSAFHCHITVEVCGGAGRRGQVFKPKTFNGLQILSLNDFH